jgi:hypothetical protein
LKLISSTYKNKATISSKLGQAREGRDSRLFDLELFLFIMMIPRLHLLVANAMKPKDAPQCSLADSHIRELAMEDNTVLLERQMFLRLLRGR